MGFTKEMHRIGPKGKYSGILELCLRTVYVNRRLHLRNRPMPVA